MWVSLNFLQHSNRLLSPKGFISIDYFDDINTDMIHQIIYQRYHKALVLVYNTNKIIPCFQ